MTFPSTKKNTTKSNSPNNTLSRWNAKTKQEITGISEHQSQEELEWPNFKLKNKLEQYTPRVNNKLEQYTPRVNNKLEQYTPKVNNKLEQYTPRVNNKLE